MKTKRTDNPQCVHKYEKHQKTRTHTCRHTHTYRHKHTRTLGRQSVNSHGRTNNVSWQAATAAATAATPTTIEGWSYIGCACVCVWCACIAIRAYQKPSGGHAVIDPNRPPPAILLLLLLLLQLLLLLLLLLVLCVATLFSLYALLLHYCVFQVCRMAEFQCLRFDWGNRRHRIENSVKFS